MLLALCKRFVKIEIEVEVQGFLGEAAVHLDLIFPFGRMGEGLIRRYRCPVDSRGSFHSAHSGKRGIHLSSRGPFSSLYYIHTGNFDFVNMESEIFSKKCWNDRPGTGDRWVSSMRTGGGFQLLAAGCQESWPACGAAITISQPGGQLSSGKRAFCSVIFTFWV